MFTNNHLIKIQHIVQPEVKVISHVVIKSETVKEVNNLTEGDNVSPAQSLFNLHKVLNANAVTILCDTTIGKKL